MQYQRYKIILYTVTSGLVVLFLMPVSTAIARPPRISGGGGVVNVVREWIKLEEREQFEVFSDTLDDLPIIFHVSLSIPLEPPDVSARLVRNGSRWYEQFRSTVLKNGLPTDDHLEFISKTERYERSFLAAYGTLLYDKETPDMLSEGESVHTLWKLVGPNNTPMDPGIYDVSFQTRPDFDFVEYFFIDGGFGGDVRIIVKERNHRDNNHYMEDLIERHYLWGSTLYRFDRKASKKEFQTAWDLVQQYLHRGAGDEPGLWNVTPRYQAFMIADKLDNNEQSISYLMQLLARNGTTKLKMRYYHFGPARDKLPRNLAGGLTQGLNNAYEQVYGKTMRGEPVTRLPIKKNFPDEDE